MTVVMWVILVGPVFGGRCGAEALGLGLGLSLGPAYRFALPPGLAAKTTRCLVFDQGRPTSHLHCRYLRSQIERISPHLSCVSLPFSKLIGLREANAFPSSHVWDNFYLEFYLGLKWADKYKYFSAKFVHMYISVFNRTIFSLTILEIFASLNFERLSSLDGNY